MDESGQFRPGQTGFPLLRVINRTNLLTFSAPVVTCSQSIVTRYSKEHQQILLAVKLQIGQISSLMEPQCIMFRFQSGKDTCTLLSLPTGCGKIVDLPNLPDGCKGTCVN